MKKRVIGIGELLWDMLPAGRCIGGAPVNFTYYVGCLGCEGYAVSAVGNDASGDDLLAEMRRNGLDDQYIQRNDHPTSQVDVTFIDECTPIYTIHENVAWDFIAAEQKTLDLVASADALCWGSLAQRNAVAQASILALVDAAPENCLKVFDINIRKPYYDLETVEASFKRANVLKLNEDEFKLLTQECNLDPEADEETRLRELMKRYAFRYVVYTKGDKGSLIVADDGTRSWMDTPSVNVVSAVGAGDSFTATFVARLLNGDSLVDAHRRAVEVSAEVCTYAGAIHPIK